MEYFVRIISFNSSIICFPPGKKKTTNEINFEFSGEDYSIGHAEWKCKFVYYWSIFLLNVLGNVCNNILN